MKDVEFYTFNNEAWFRTDSTNEKLTEKSTKAIGFLLDVIYERYPEAYKALEKEYKSIPEGRFKRFKMANRFCKCNFGNIDNVNDVDRFGRFVFEYIPCPLRGECKLEGVVCGPKFNSNISDSEMRVLELQYRGLSPEEIAEKLFLSPFTVRNHIRNAYSRLGFHEKAEFIDYAHRNKLFKDDEC